MAPPNKVVIHFFNLPMKNSVIFHSDVKEPEGTGDNDVPLDLGRP